MSVNIWPASQLILFCAEISWGDTVYVLHFKFKKWKLHFWSGKWQSVVGMDIRKTSLVNHCPPRISTCKIKPFKEIRQLSVTFAHTAENIVFSEWDFGWSLHRCCRWDYRGPNQKAAGELSLASSLRHKETWAGQWCGSTMNHCWMATEPGNLCTFLRAAEEGCHRLLQWDFKSSSLARSLRIFLRSS